MELSASMDVVAIVLTLLIVVVGYAVSCHYQYKLLTKMNHKLTLLLSKDEGNNDDTTDR
jgi:hypothetical protein